ncbi:alpha/beta hydrolase-fold protein [Tenacibaculum tangerinum]|uniref:Alpha/beta hydrolase-fold protein n=1 Tax=Tenacibaculum tangerinum TaxID=3038772 RepID=A0ABY8L7X6_9FLAO|nr:alpha/beta hydrolase-fold protein [Tenacibaculum tangerinum]WGH76727.1 alpha/beta hydrolase-fold protein [Tenacibaculum tangerinum]
MKQVYLFIGLLLISANLFSQKIITQKVNSKELKGDRGVKIYLPKNYESDLTTNYPVAIVLGDEYLFDLYVGNAKLYANVDKAPRQIVVGIDMKATYAKDVSVIPANNSLTSVGLHFFNFIKHELIPFMEGNFRTSPFMTIVGEGEGANFVTHYLKDAEPIFNSYICITPEFPQFAPNIIESYSLERLNSIDNTYFIYLSNNEKYIETKQGDRFKQIGNYLSSFDNENLHITVDAFKNAPSYLSIIAETIPRAFTKMFALYSKITKEEFDTHVKDLAPLDAIKYVEKKYLDIQYLYGSNLNVRIDDIFAIEDIVIDRQDGDYLRVLGDFVMIKYPDSHMGDFYVGKYYELGKDYEKADFYYKAAYGKMDPSNPNADAFYENIKRVNDLMGGQKKDEMNDEEEIDEEDKE